MSQPLVSVICLCYNHERFVQEAIESVWLQNYPSIQLIIVDDASLDNSVSVINRIIKNRPDVPFIVNEKNQGSCRSFNQALKLVKGDFIIDLSADDVLLPNRASIGVKEFETVGLEYGVQFSDADIISEVGSHLHYHSDQFPHTTIPEGDIYKDLVDRYFICSPTMMFRREVMVFMGGYDESLTFEDFDLWIRSSRKFKYCYVPDVLIKRRLVKTSMSRKQFVRSNAQRWSTLKVCQKIKELNRTSGEERAFRHRLSYELFLSLRMMDVRLAFEFLKLWW